MNVHYAQIDSPLFLSHSLSTPLETEVSHSCHLQFTFKLAQINLIIVPQIFGLQTIFVFMGFQRFFSKQKIKREWETSTFNDLNYTHFSLLAFLVASINCRRWQLWTKIQQQPQCLKLSASEQQHMFMRNKNISRSQTLSN
jgi:hypothetical protein